MAECGIPIWHQAKNRMVDVIVTTAGGVEEDLIKVRGPPHAAHYCGVSYRAIESRLRILCTCFVLCFLSASGRRTSETLR